MSAWVSQCGRFRIAFLSVLLAAFFVVTSAVAAPGSPPVVTQQPELSVVEPGIGFGSFDAAAEGTPTPAVQWQVSSDRLGPWANIAGATSTTLSPPVSDAGNAYRAVFTNAGGTAISRPAKLVSTSDWMHDLSGDIGDVPLTELTIPGAHDMGTYGITDNSPTALDDQASSLECDVTYTACNSYARAQDPLDATDELSDGIRYFDLRVCGQGTDTPETTTQDFATFSTDAVTCHGLDAAPFADILTQTKAYVLAHPGEVVYLDVDHIYQADADLIANQIEHVFALPDGGSLLIPPQYCTTGDPTSGTCAGGLTLHTIAQGQLGNVIVNMENDGAPGDVFQDPIFCDPAEGLPCALFNIQPTLDEGFYDRHHLIWGRSATAPTAMEYCTVAAAEASCFGNDSDPNTVLPRVKNFLDTRATFAEPDSPHQFQHFFVEYLQTTPDGTYILEHLTSSLFDMANESNPVIGPAIFGCDGTWGISDCFGQLRPENLNVLAINFYDRTDYGPVTFDFVKEVLKFDEYARTAPVVTVGSSLQPAATGWYNAAVLGGQGKTLPVDVSASDYRYPTGITALSCLDNTTSLGIAPNVPTSASTATGQGSLAEGVHAITCSAADGAVDGAYHQGNTGAGPGSTPFPATFKIDTTPPQIQCSGNAQFLLNQPNATLAGAVTDATSGAAAATVSTPVSTAAVGSFTTTLTGTDVAGNSATVICPYTVSYRIALEYDPTNANKSGSSVPIMIELQNYSGNDVSSKTITLTAKTVTNTVAATTMPPTGPGASEPNNLFSFSTSPAMYTYVLKTTGYQSGSYTLDFVISGDPLTQHAPFSIR